MVQYRFNREERLRGKGAIEELFSVGRTLYVHPFKVFYHAAPACSTCHKALFAVSHRAIKKALSRNTVKRRSREAYRMAKHILQPDPKLHIGFVYTSGEVLPYTCLQQAIVQSMQRLNKRIKKT